MARRTRGIEELLSFTSVFQENSGTLRGLSVDAWIVAPCRNLFSVRIEVGSDLPSPSTLWLGGIGSFHCRAELYELPLCLGETLNGGGEKLDCGGWLDMEECVKAVMGEWEQSASFGAAD